MDYHAEIALVVVDVQNDFADPAGSLYVRGGEDVVAAVNREVAAAVGVSGRPAPSTIDSTMPAVGEMPKSACRRRACSPISMSPVRMRLA